MSRLRPYRLYPEPGENQPPELTDMYHIFAAQLPEPVSAAFARRYPHGAGKVPAANAHLPPHHSCEKNPMLATANHSMSLVDQLDIVIVPLDLAQQQLDEEGTSSVSVTVTGASWLPGTRP
jgi:hypothetical protein